METEQEIFERIKKTNKDCTNKLIIELMESQKKYIETQQKLSVIFKLKRNLPVIATTLNNKIVQISQLFIRNGVSMYATMNNGKAQPSILGEMIILDLFSYTYEGEEKLQQIDEVLESVAQTNTDRLQAIINSSKLQRIALAIKSGIRNTDPTVLQISEEEQNKIKDLYKEYIKKDEELWNYELKDYLSQAVIKYMRKFNYSVLVFPDIMQNIRPDLKAIGLEPIIPELEADIDIEYKKELRELTPLIRNLKVYLNNQTQNISKANNIIGEIHSQNKGTKTDVQEEK